jgi:ABC-type multidrug transport system fused ATPase/permease subunit
MIRAIRERKGVCKVKTVNTYFKKHIGAVLLWVLFTLAVSFFAPLKSFQLKWLIDSTSKEEAIRYLFLVFGVTIASYVFESLSRRTFTNIACHAVQGVRNDVMEKVLGRTMSDYDAEEDSTYISLLTTDIRTLYDDYYMAIFNIVFWGGIMLCALGLYFYISPLMLLVILVVSVPPLVLPRFMNARLKKARDAFSAEMASYTQHIKEYLGGFAVIRGFLRESEFSRRHREFSRENHDGHDVHRGQYGEFCDLALPSDLAELRAVKGLKGHPRAAGKIYEFCKFCESCESRASRSVRAGE